MIENDDLYFINQIIEKASVYDKTDEALKPLADAIYDYLSFRGVGEEYVVFADDDMNVKIMYEQKAKDNTIIDIEE